MSDQNQQNAGYIPEGLTVRFIANCPHGLIGEVKTISRSTALTLVERKHAELIT
jgi:hypothetical protein